MGIDIGAIRITGHAIINKTSTGFCAKARGKFGYGKTPSFAILDLAKRLNYNSEERK